jgi:tryptophan synthase beta chain
MFDYQQPDPRGHFGIYGGSFISETLTHAVNELKSAYAKYQYDPAFIAEFESELAHFVGRPSPVYHAARMSREMGGAQIFLKREDLNHTGAHKINNTIGQAMLAKRMGKPRVIAETGAGQHGVATATICARYGLECVVYMGSEDVKRQSPNVYRMKLLGATVVPVESGSKTLKDALNEAMRDWVANVDNTFYIIGTVAGPHPYPMMVRDFQSVIGKECLVQMPEMLQSAGCSSTQPDVVVACVGGGSNAMGIFYPYIQHEKTRLIGVEAAGAGMDSGKHSASIQRGSPGVLHGNRTYVLQDDNGQVTETHSISAGLDYPGVGPEHAFLHDIGRAEYVGITDTEALKRFTTCAARRASSRRWNPATPWPTPCSWPRPCAPTSRFWSTCRDAATRTLARWPTCLGPTFSAAPVARANRSREMSNVPLAHIEKAQKAIKSGVPQ